MHRTQKNQRVFPQRPSSYIVPKAWGIGEYKVYKLYYVSILYKARHTTEVSGAQEPLFCFMKKTMLIINCICNEKFH
jgi:hypothetical protein